MTISDSAGQLVTAAAAAYADDSKVRVVLVPGQLIVNDFVWPGCETVWIRLDTAYPATVFPTPDIAPATCGAPLALRFHVGVARCVHDVGSDGSAPAPEDQAEDALGIIADVEKLRLMLCQVASSIGKGNTSLGSWQPMGPAGGVAGGWWPFTIRMLR